MKDVVLSAVSNHAWHDLEPYVRSLGACGFAGDKVMLVRGLEPGVEGRLRSEGFKLVPMGEPTHADFCVERHRLAALYLRAHRYRFCVWTDVRDVIFQLDPAEWLDQNMEREGLIGCSECARISDEPTNRRWLDDLVGAGNACGVYGEEVLNGGTIAGDASSVADLMEHVYAIARKATFKPADQAAVNWLLHTRFRYETRVPKMAEGFALVGSWLVQPRHYGILTDKPPIVEDGMICAADSGKPFAIVHQYDRNAELKRMVDEKYRAVEYNVTLPPESCFQEIAETVTHSLRALGYSAQLNYYIIEGVQNIVLGAQLAPFDLIPDGSIIYNFEQVGSYPFVGNFVNLLKRCVVWDYSQLNVEQWRKRGIESQYVPLGYRRELSKIIPKPLEDIDVLFYGMCNPRRLSVIDDLASRGLKVVARSEWMGPQRDEAIARAKVCLNVHFYKARVFEIARVSYLLANRKCVVTEDSADMGEYDDLVPGMSVVSYERLADECERLAKHERERKRLERAGFDAFASRPQEAILRSVLVPLEAAA